MAIPSIAQNLADAYLTAFKAFVHDGGGTGQAKLQIYNGDPMGAGTKLAEMLLDGTTPFAATATASGYRQTQPTTGGTSVLSTTGLSAAGAGTNADHYRIMSEAGHVVEVGTARGAGDTDTGEQMVLSNKNIANGQAVNLTSYIKRVAMALGNV